jgi:hypothetical protein
MSRAWGLQAELKARGGGDAVTSLTTSNAEIDQRPENDSLDIYDGSVRVAEEHFDNTLPLPCALIGQVEIDFSGDQGSLVAKGRGIRVVLTDKPGTRENFQP